MKEICILCLTTSGVCISESTCRENLQILSPLLIVSDSLHVCTACAADIEKAARTKTMIDCYQVRLEEHLQRENQVQKCQLTIAEEQSMTGELYITPNISQPLIPKVAPKKCSKRDGAQCLMRKRKCVGQHKDNVHGTDQLNNENLGGREIGEESQISCDVCLKKYSYINTMLRHRQTAHAGSRRYLCTICNSTHPSFALLARHVRASHQHQVQLSSACLICDICGLSFLSQAYLKDHRKKHEEPRFTCCFCGKYFVTKRSAMIHERQHTGEKPFTCEKCGKSFPGKNYLINHQHTHDDIKTFVCSTCGKGFSKKWNLVQHERIHTGERPYKCPFCSESFTQNFLLKAHLPKVHQQDWREVLST